MGFSLNFQNIFVNYPLITIKNEKNKNSLSLKFAGRRTHTHTHTYRSLFTLAKY